MPSTSASPQPGTNVNSSSSNMPPRPLGRSTTLGDLSASPARLRRGSTFSDTVSEARYSIKSSTSGLFFPRAYPKAPPEPHDDGSHWQSAPLALALLPAVAGIFFQNGSALITDITLLIIAAVFLNWSVRLPWEWYTSAQQIGRAERETESDMEATTEEQDDDNLDQESADSPRQWRQPRYPPPQAQVARRARSELYMHEILALASCFVFPIVGAWVLHAIRSQLSRPSEGLVSNYNLTIFLFAAEIRPISHLLKLVQARTLYLQRVVSVNSFDDERADTSQVNDLMKRLEELEAHVAESASRTSVENSRPINEVRREKQKDPNETTVRVAREVWRQFQPELEALKRAVRKYEKRTTISAFETDRRLCGIEARLDEVVAMDAVANQKPRLCSTSIILTPVTLICWAIKSPLQTLWMFVCLPAQLVRWCLRKLARITGSGEEGVRNQKPVQNKTRRHSHSADKR